MTKLECMEVLRVAGGGFHDLQGGLTGDGIEAALPEEGVVVDLAFGEGFYVSTIFSQQSGEVVGKHVKRGEEPLVVCECRSEILQSHQHGRERTRHHRALLNNGELEDTRCHACEFAAVACHCKEVCLVRVEIGRDLQDLGGVTGARDKDGEVVLQATGQSECWADQNLRRWKSACTNPKQHTETCCSSLCQIEACAAANEDPMLPGGFIVCDQLPQVYRAESPQ